MHKIILFIYTFKILSVPVSDYLTLFELTT